jgi:hypothetical protein
MPDWLSASAIRDDERVMPDWLSASAILADGPAMLTG